MKEISYGKSACILLFSALGVFTYFLLLYHTELQERIPDIKISLIALSITIAVFNLFGFSLLVSSHWMATNYPLYYIDKSRMLWHYLLVAILLLLMNCTLFISLKWITSIGDPFVIRAKGAGLVIAVWFVEMIIFSLLLINYSMRYTLNLYKEKQRLEAESIQAKYTALQSQLNPHFLFNSLNTLIAEIEYDPATAVKFTQHLSEVYRYVLRQQQCQIVSLKEELDFLDSYIFLHQVRLGDCLSLERDLPDNVIDHQLPPLTLQLLAENVVKHNYIDDFNPMTIRVYTERNSRYLCVSNTLRPKKVSNASGKGLKNLSERYQLLCKQDIQIRKNDHQFTVSIPLIYE